VRFHAGRLCTSYTNERKLQYANTYFYSTCIHCCVQFKGLRSPFREITLLVFSSENAQRSSGAKLYNGLSGHYYIKKKWQQCDIGGQSCCGNHKNVFAKYTINNTKLITFGIRNLEFGTWLMRLNLERGNGETRKIPGDPGPTLIFGTALLESLVFKINKYYWRRKSCNKADRAVLHDGVRFLIFDRMTETCCRLRPLEGYEDK
jgi:hypothetical protein